MKNSFERFDGRHPHGTTPITAGQRYSIVFFVDKAAKKLSSAQRHSDFCFQVPSDFCRLNLDVSAWGQHSDGRFHKGVGPKCRMPSNNRSVSHDSLHQVGYTDVQKCYDI